MHRTFFRRPGAAALFAALLAGLFNAPALADDPKDPALRTAAARAADRERTRRLNLGELAHVRQRDAAYAQGWAAARAAAPDPSGNEGYAAALRDHRARQTAYENDRADYDRRMAQWRRQVAACHAGEISACDN